VLELNVIDDATIEANLNTKINRKFSTVCVLVNDNNDVYDIKRIETYDELKLKFVKFKDILNSPNFVRPTGLSNRQGFGAQNGLSTLSPIHFKFTDTFTNRNYKEKEYNKVKKHIGGINKEFIGFLEHNKDLVILTEYFFKKIKLEDLKDKPNEDLKDKPNEDLKDKPNEDLKDKLNEDLKDKPNEDPKDKLNEDLKDKLNEDLKDKPNDYNLIYNDFTIEFKKDDYLIFLKDNFNVINFNEQFNVFVKNKIKKKYDDLSIGKENCCVCGSFDEIYKPEKGNFQTEQYNKHSQLYHYRNIDSKNQKYIGYCKKCFDKLNNIFEIIENNKIYNLILPTSNNEDNMISFKNIYLDKDKQNSLLNNLKDISNNSGNLINFILYQFKDYKRDDFTIDFAKDFNYIINDNLDSLKSIFNNISYNKFNINSKKNNSIIEPISDRYNKSDFLLDLKLFFKGTFYENQLYFNYDLNRIKDFYQKYLVSKYKKSVFDYIYLQKDYLFYGKLFDELLLDILKIILKSSEFRKYYSIDNIQKLLLKYYKIDLIIRGGKNMCVDKIKHFDNKISKLIENIINKDANINLDLENDYEASYIFGHMLYYILSNTNSSKKEFEQLSKEMLNINNIEQLKMKTHKLYMKYSYNLREDKFVRIMLNSILKYKYNSTKLDEQLIALLTGFTSQKNLFLPN